GLVDHYSQCQFFSRSLIALGRGSNLIGNDGKASALLASAECFDGGIKDKKVCLLGYDRTPPHSMTLGGKCNDVYSSIIRHIVCPQGTT
ncbi:hypothetical protein, partial [Marinobacter sp. UBA2498]|uniref:hypothetical protein n=1 Tax=Marinobacter sp. UBA2498 TaxID=1946813 RepID=UPI003BB93C4E